MTLQVIFDHPDFVDALAPGTTPSAVAGASGAITGTYKYIVVSNTIHGGVRSDESSPVTVTSKHITVTVPAHGSGSVVSREIWRTEDDGDVYYLVHTIEDNSTTSYSDNLTDAGLTGQPLDLSGPNATGHVVDVKGLGALANGIQYNLTAAQETAFMAAHEGIAVEDDTDGCAGDDHWAVDGSSEL